MKNQKSDKILKKNVSIGKNRPKKLKMKITLPTTNNLSFPNFSERIPEKYLLLKFPKHLRRSKSQ